LLEGNVSVSRRGEQQSLVILVCFVETNWPKYNDYLKQMADFEQKALESRKPAAHTYAIILEKGEL
jgi:hypothetical protein